jgi:hypothetical protein
LKLLRHIGRLPDVVEASFVVVGRELGRRAAGGIDDRRAQLGELGATFLEGLEIFRELRIGLPKTQNTGGATYDAQAVIGQDFLRAGRYTSTLRPR